MSGTEQARALQLSLLDGETPASQHGALPPMPWLATGWAGVNVYAVKLGKMVENYLEHSERRATLKPSSIRKYRQAAGWAGEMLLEDAHQVKTGWAQRHHDRLTEERGPGSADKVICLLSAAWQHAVRYDEVPAANPFRSVRRNGDTRTDIVFEQGFLPRALAVIEQARADEPVLWHQVERTGKLDPTAAGIISVAMSTAARWGCEVLRMRWEDFDGRTILFPDSKIRPRTIPVELLAPAALRAVERQRGLHDTWVWPSPKGANAPVGKSTIHRYWAPTVALLRRHGLRMRTVDGRQITAYEGSRHAAITYWLGELKVPAETVRELVGHDSDKVLAKYTHLNVEHLRQEARAISNTYEQEDLMVKVEKAGLRPARIKAAIEELKVNDPEKLELLVGPKDEPVSERTLQNWGNGSREPNAANLHRLALLSGKPIEFFFGDDALQAVAARRGGAN